VLQATLSNVKPSGALGLKLAGKDWHVVHARPSGVRMSDRRSPPSGTQTTGAHITCCGASRALCPLRLPALRSQPSENCANDKIERCRRTRSCNGAGATSLSLRRCPKRTGF